MIKSVTVINHLGESLKMELTRPEASAGFYIQRIEGLGPVTANINITERAIGDGASYGSARANSRNIVMYLGFLDSGVNGDIETIRHRSYKYFPLKKRVTIQIETDKRICETYGYVESNEPDIFSNGQTTQISIICPDSYFYDASRNSDQIVSFSDLTPAFSFPFSNKADSLVFGNIRINEEQVIKYDGDIEVGMEIHIEAVGGVYDDIALYNLDTNEHMIISINALNVFLNSSGIKTGDKIIIATSRGEKSITLRRDSESYNIINCLGKHSNWLQLIPGENTFAYSTAAGTENLNVQIFYKAAYVGV